MVESTVMASATAETNFNAAVLKPCRVTVAENVEVVANEDERLRLT